jgi:tetratricopeptide (TPR) repeat protein
MRVRPQLPEPDDAAWEVAAANHERAAHLLEHGRLAEAEELARGAVAALAKAVGAEHPDTANAMDTVASILQARGHLAEALDRYAAALAVFDLWRGEEAVEPMRVSSLQRYGRALVDAGQYDRAREILGETLDVNRQLFGDEHADVAASLNALGIVEKLAGRYSEAQAFYRQAVSMLERLGESIPPELSHNLAGLAVARGDGVAAEGFARRAIANRPSGQASLALGTDLAGLGDALTTQGRHLEAEASYREALAMYRHTGHDEHPEVAYALHNLGDVLAALGRSAEAESCYREAIARKMAAFGEMHHEVAASLANLAALCAETGRRVEALEHAERAVAMCAGHVAVDHPVRAGCEALLGDLKGKRS